MLDLAIDLSQSFFAAHGEDRMSESDEGNDPRKMTEPLAVKPSHGFFGEGNHAGPQRIGRQLDRRS
jgi:hypothetical protein